MLNLLSIRYKLILAVVISIIGFIILGGVALQVLIKLENTSAVVEQSQNTAMVVSRTEAEMLKLNLQKTLLTAENLSDLKQQIIHTRTSRSQALKQSAQSSNNQQLIQLLNQLEQQLNAYMGELAQWLEQKQSIGFDKNTGLIGELNTSGKAISEAIQGFSIAEHAVGKVLGAEKAFFMAPSQQSIEQHNAYILELESVLTDMDFIEEYGHLLHTYRNQFTPVASQWLALGELEIALHKRVPQVEQTVSATVNLLDSGVIPAAMQSAAQANSQARWILVITALAAVATVLKIK